MLRKAKTLVGLLSLVIALGWATETRATTVKFTGQVGYQVLSSNSVNLSAVQVSNESSGGISGTIRMELWAFPASYTSGLPGYRLAVASLGQLQGGYDFSGVSQNVTYGSPPNGTWYVSMFLTEYVGSGSDDGYQLDDSLNFSNPLQVGPVTPPTVATQPAAQTVVAGGTATFSVSASGGGTLSYQWFRNGTAITGATSAALSLSNVQSANAGSYTVSISNSGGSVTSAPAVLTVNAAISRLVNLSVRTVAGTGSQSLIAGFVLGGTGTTGTTPLLVRAMGPSLAPFGVTGVLPDPVLALIQSGVTITSNAGWGGNAQIMAADTALGAFAFTNASSLDSAIYTSLLSGSYSAQISGRSNDTGIALAEVYDATPSASFASTAPQLINVSARSQVGIGSGVLIAGMVIGGNAPERVLIRGIGPTLASFGVAGVLAAPILGIYDQSSNLIASNIGWSNAPVPGTSTSGAGFQAATAATMASVSAFALPAGSADSALVVTLPPGNYSAEVSGVNNTTGVALVEAYELPAAAGTPPVISAQPTSQTITSGGAGTLSVTASGATSYQWYLNGSPISGATASSYAVGSAGTYTVVVTNAYGSTTSAAATITVTTASGGGGSTSSLTVYPGQGFYGSYDPYKKSSIVDGGTLIAYGGSPASGYTWTLSTGSTLPPGVSLQPFGLVTYSGGTVIPGNYSFNVTVSDGSKTATGVVTFSVDTESTAPDANGIPGTQASQGFSQITVDPFALTTGKVGVYYGESVFVNLAGAGNAIGTPTPLPLSWSVAGGSSLPPGLVLDSARGVVRGTPTAAGNYSFHIVVQDNAGNVAYGSPTYTLTVNP